MIESDDTTQDKQAMLNLEIPLFWQKYESLSQDSKTHLATS